MANRRDRLLREAFWELVDRHGSRAGTLLEFGCGTGIDGARYVQLGFRVIAYDVSPAMIERLRERCPHECASGQVVPVVGHKELQAALSRVGEMGVTTLTANFAVVNLLEDLGELRDLVTRHLPSLRTVVIAILNPFFGRDMLRSWWWRGLLRSSGFESIDARDTDFAPRRYFVHSVLSAIGPSFEVVEQRTILRGRIRSSFPLNRMGHMRLLALVRKA